MDTTLFLNTFVPFDSYIYTPVTILSGHCPVPQYFRAFRYLYIIPAAYRKDVQMICLPQLHQASKSGIDTYGQISVVSNGKSASKSALSYDKKSCTLGWNIAISLVISSIRNACMFDSCCGVIPSKCSDFSASNLDVQSRTASRCWQNSLAAMLPSRSSCCIKWCAD